MRLRAWGSFRSTSSWRPLAGLLLIMAVLGCFFAPLSFAQPHSDAAPVAVATGQSVGMDATATGPTMAQAVTQNSVSVVLPRLGNAASVPPAGMLAQNCDSSCSVGNVSAGIVCLVLAVFTLIWLIRLPMVDALRPRRLPTAGSLVRFFLTPVRTPSLLVLSISRV